MVQHLHKGINNSTYAKEINLCIKNESIRSLKILFISFWPLYVMKFVRLLSLNDLVKSASFAILHLPEWFFLGGLIIMRLYDVM